MEWWVFPALVLCAVTFVAAAGVLVFLAAHGVWRLLARYEPTHALAPGGERWVPWDTDPRFGSMQLDADRAYQERVTWAMDAWQPPNPAAWLGAPLDRALEAWRPDWREVAHEGDWRAQTAADLAPAALDSGPGGPSLAPGPDPAASLCGPEQVLGEPGNSQLGGRGVEALSGHTEPEPVHTVAGRLVETSDEWLRRLVANAAPGWTYAGTVAA